MSHFYLRKSYTFSESDEKMLDIRKEMSNFLTKEEAELILNKRYAMIDPNPNQEQKNHMIIEEIHSFFVNEGRQTIELEFTVSEDDNETTTHLELLIEDIESLCDLFDEVEWYDSEDEETDYLQLQRKINPYELKEGLGIYINQNKNLVF